MCLVLSAHVKYWFQDRALFETLPQICFCNPAVMSVIDKWMELIQIHKLMGENEQYCFVVFIFSITQYATKLHRIRAE